ncbi:MAG: hypothetical protein FJ280_29690 [Planctomycetes bacterium]|nr:hypothetical protein [Planctomycetota bacterium]
MKTDEIIRQIRSCESMCEAGRAATAYFLEVCRSDPSLIPPTGNSRLRDIHACHDDLERTYLVRMFAIIEMALREFWRRAAARRSHPAVNRLMDRIALRCNIAVDHRTRAQSVRGFRNTLVHGGTGKSVTLGDARSYLCGFLSNLPRDW